MKDDYEVAHLKDEEVQQLKAIEAEFGYTLVAYHPAGEKRTEEQSQQPL